jgi:hypothetical protein
MKFMDAVVEPHLFTVVKAHNSFDIMLCAGITINYNKVDDNDNIGMILCFDDVNIPAEVPKDSIKFNCSFPYVGFGMAAPPTGYNILTLGVVDNAPKSVTTQSPVHVVRVQWP